MAQKPKTKDTDQDDTRSDSKVRADIPDELFAEALRSIERIEQELRGTSGGEAETPADLTSYVIDDSDAGEGDLAELMRLLDATDSTAPDAEPDAVSEDESEIAPDDLPDDVLPDRPLSAEDVDDGDAIIASLLARDRSDGPEPDGDSFADAPSTSEPDKRLQELLHIKEEQLRELMERFGRAQDDFDKYKQRIDRDRDDQRKFAGEEIILKILPIADSFERAAAHGRASEDPAAFAEGVELIYKQFQDVLTNLGLAPIEAVGESFDPTYHEAMLHLEDPDAEPNAVISEYQKGYLLHGRLLRPSKVVVAKAVGKSAEPRDE